MYIVTLYFIYKEECKSWRFQFDSLVDAVRFATDSTDHFHDLGQVDVLVSWSSKKF